MGIEIERKFLVCGDSYRRLATGVQYVQGYISSTARHTVRVRLAGDRAFLAVKGLMQANLVRSEYEYAIPLSEAQAMLREFCGENLVEKIRYEFHLGDFLWCVDEFLGKNQGLTVAEVEMSSPEQSPPLPDWVDLEVTHDSRYHNAYLAYHPYQSWKQI